MRLRMIPPAWLVLSILAMWALDRYLPLIEVFSTSMGPLGVLLMFSGALIVAISAWEFRKAGTTVRPFEESTALVTSGPFSKSRNPMYFGMVLVLVGVALMLGSFSPWLVLPAFVYVIQTFFIRPEEADLAEKFPTEYESYRKSVRRWF